MTTWIEQRVALDNQLTTNGLCAGDVTLGTATDHLTDSVPTRNWPGLIAQKNGLLAE